MPQNIVFSDGSDSIYILTPEGPEKIAELSLLIAGIAPGVTLDNGLLLFNAHDGTDRGRALWATDGTSEGTGLISDITHFSGYQLCSTGDRAFFISPHPDVGAELWKTDGSNSGTVLVKDINPGEESSRAPVSLRPAYDYENALVAFNDGVLFFAGDEDPYEIFPYFSDGTKSGTVKLTETAPGTGFAGVLPPVAFEAGGVLGDRAFFRGSSEEHGKELWVTDGTPSGTRMVADIYPGGLGSDPEHFVSFEDQVYFSAFNGREIWFSDGTADGTGQLAEGLRLISGLEVVNDRLLFVADDYEHGKELWVSDGTKKGTKLLSDIWLGSEDGVSTVLGKALVTVGDGSKAVFVAGYPKIGRELWVTDGTARGTKLLKNIRVEDGDGSSSPDNFLKVDDLVYFSAKDETEGHTLWVTDGTAKGTRMVADPNPGSFGSEVIPIGSVETATEDPSVKLVGTSEADRLEGGAGADILRGLGGADELFGKADTDRLFGGAGQDILRGGTGHDKLFGGAGRDTLLGSAGKDDLNGGGALDTLRGGRGSDTLDGGAMRDKLFGGAGRDLLEGGAGHDKLNGGGGNDQIFGGQGEDVLLGRGGKDKLDGRAGADTLTGGKGADTFMFRSGKQAAGDTITDFRVKQGDRINLRKIDADETSKGDQAFDLIDDAVFSGTAGELRTWQGKSKTFVAGDVDGDGRADFRIKLEGSLDLGEEDFLL